MEKGRANCLLEVQPKKIRLSSGGFVAPPWLSQGDRQLDGYSYRYPTPVAQTHDVGPVVTISQLSNERVGSVICNITS